MKNDKPIFRLAAPSERDWQGLIIFVAVVAIAAVLYVPAHSQSGLWIQLGFAVSAMGVVAIVIWQVCDPFAEAAQWVGKRFRIPSSVRGATLDAIASSMPELFSGIFFVTVALSAANGESQQQLTEGFGSSIAICAGSSIYNLILIPAVCAFAISTVRKQRPQIEFSSEVINRDGAWVILSQLGLLIVLFLPQLPWWIGLLGIGVYLVYILQMCVDAARHRQDTVGENYQLPEGTPLFFGMFELSFNLFTVLLTLVVSALAAAAACYGLVELTNYSAAAMHVPAFFVAVILAAAASSIPDTFVSLGSARRGDDSGAISNVFGSNIFDICIGMSVPLLVCCYLNDWQPLVLINEENKETIRGVAGLRILLFVLTAIVMYLLWTKRKINRTMAWFFCFLYLVFVGYAVLGSMNLL